MTSAAIPADFVQRNPAPKVTVCVVTYNQKDFIAQCLQSLVDQQTDFPFEILVGDDCSTDGTSEIVAGFVNKYPGLVFVHRYGANIGAYLNYVRIHSWAAGRGSDYIAHVDGDDCALPGKLQAQADVLDRFPQVALSAHAVRVMGRSQVIGAEEKLPELAGLEDVLRLGAYFVNSSTMYRSVNYVARDEGQDFVDFYLYVEQSTRGAIHLNRRILGEYRWHDLGISKSAAHRDRIEKAYDAAFDLALRSGADSQVVIRSRLKRRMSFSIAALVDGRDDKFRQKIRLSGHEWQFASMPHRVLSLGRFLVRGRIRDYLVRRFTGA